MKGRGAVSLRKSVHGHQFAMLALIAVLAALVSPRAEAAGQIQCNRDLSANVVALDMPLMFNRLGAQNINGMMFALRGDVVDKGSLTPIPDLVDEGSGNWSDPQGAGTVTLRPDKRPRPLVLRMGAGDCMTITLSNLLEPVANPHEVSGTAVCDVNNPGEVRSGIPFNCEIDDQVAAREISLRFQGTQLVGDIGDDGSFVGQNASSLVAPGKVDVFKIYAPYDGAFIGVSMGGTIGGEGMGGQTASGLWAVLNVNAKDSAFYKSEITNEDLNLVTVGTNPVTGHPVIDYEATYPMAEPWISEGKAGKPVVNMFQGGEQVHSMINAIVAYGPNLELAAAPDGPYAGIIGHFPTSNYPLEDAGHRNPTVPNRLEPFREFTVAFHDEVSTTQAFPKWFEDPVMRFTLHGVRDSFMINYGSGGIGSEIIANRLGVGPMHDCVNCAYEEFFLTSHTVGEIGQLTDIPANFGLEECDPALNNCGAVGPKANYILYPEDPSNIHHSYVGDGAAFRNLHAGPGEQHVFHLHNHQWLFNADDDNSNYLDAQGLGPGAGYAYWINFGGSGNRNMTSGDAIFHCHFYPHFAQGMWEMWRIHDTFEPGTELETTVANNGAHTSFTVDGIGIGDGTPAAGARALPDAEVIVGAPTPAVLPLPGKAMAPMPAAGVTVVENNDQVPVCLDGNNMRVPRDSAGACVAGTVETLQAVGSLTSVPRDNDADSDGIKDGAYGADGVFGNSDDRNPGYPFWIAGMEHTVGNRPPTPPLDMMTFQEAQALKATGGELWQHPGLDAENAIDGWDGGLPRFTLEGYSAGSEAAVAITRLDMSKEVLKAKPVFFPEEGTDLERIAMGYHATRCHDSSKPDGTAADCSAGTNIDYGNGLVRPIDQTGGFLSNGSLPIPGAPYMDPCIDDRGMLLTGVEGKFFGGSLTQMHDSAGMTVYGSSPHTTVKPRVYKAANVQFDAVFNKQGYHFPQERIITLWQDVIPTIKQERPPEPFVLRMNTFDCTQYVHANVVPNAYELDDYQVRTPTDIIGQHIHLPKWDLTSADGSANGWNYEDGTLSPQAVVEIIRAINAYNTDPANTPVTTRVDGLPVVTSDGHTLSPEDVELHPSVHPFFGMPGYGAMCEGAEGVEIDPWCGARSTLQRWFADPVVNVQGIDRGLGIIFTHDHYGPSTHQQVGLYATVLIEPAGSKWVHNEQGVQLGENPDGSSPAGRIDGGPTSWQAAILTGDDGFGSYYNENVGGDLVDNHREFYIEYSDFQHAYQPGVYVGRDRDGNQITPHDIHDPWDDATMKYPEVIGAENIHNTFRDAVQPPYRLQASVANTDGFPVDIWEFPTTCLGGGVRPCPEAITADDPGMYVVNYRNESVASRIYDPNRNDCPDGKSGCQAKGKAGDLAFALDSNVSRAIPELNDKAGLMPATYNDGNCTGGVFCPPINSQAAMAGGDPVTPMMRAYDGDRVHVKMQAGGQEEEHAAMFHGLKWLQAGSGFGEAKNSGWRNAQSGGISEQFSLRTPVYADFNQRGSNQADYAYAFNPSLDGWTNGSWGVLRSYASNTSGLMALPDNDPNKSFRITNAKDFNKVCPKTAPVRSYDITAVSVNDVLPAVAGVTIQDLFPNSHVGAAPDGDGGTLVYNSRPTFVAGTDAGTRGSNGELSILHDPTAIIYVNTADLVAKDPGGTGNGANFTPNDPYCWRMEAKAKYDPSLPSCKVRLADGVPVEPVVIRANAGDCLDVTLRNKVLQQAYDDNGDVLFQADGKPAFEDKRGKGPQYELSADTNKDGIGDAAPYGNVYFDQTMDLATGNAIAAVQRRDRGAGAVGMTSFQSNLMQPSAHVGLHPQLLEYDITRSDGTNVGTNPAQQSVAPGSQGYYQWYAGHIEMKTVTGPSSKRNVALVATPIEFGGFNLMPTDKLEQGQKALVGAGVIYPQGSTWEVEPGRTTAATVYAPGGTFRDFTTVATKGAGMLYSDSYPVENIEGEGTFGVAEDSQDMGHMAINYGNEAMWFRYGRNPTEAAGNALCAGDGADVCLGGVASAEAAKAYSNTLTGGDPETAVFEVDAGVPFRMHVLMPFAPGRGSTYDLHGHVWQRDPYVCPGDNDLGIPGKCDMGNGIIGSNGTGKVGSRALGDNPIGFHLGGIESWFSGQHYEIVIPSAGGSNAVPGDYLFRDHMGLGNAGGLWGIVRVK